VRLVGEAGLGGGDRRGSATGEQPPRGPDAQLALVVAGRHSVLGLETTMQGITAAAGNVGQLVRANIVGICDVEEIPGLLNSGRCHTPMTRYPRPAGRTPAD